MEEVIQQQKEQCIFCKIVKGEIPAIKVYEDNLVLAIMDINPATEGHMLLMPKEHYPIAPIIPPETFQHMIKIAKYLGRAAKNALHKDKISFFIANGGVAGQQSTHFMMHILPRNSKELTFLDAYGDEQYDPELAQAIREKFSQKQSTQAPENKKQKIAELYNSNEEFRDLLLNKRDMLKQIIETNPEWKELFDGIDIDALSTKLRDMNNG